MDGITRTFFQIKQILNPLFSTKTSFHYKKETKNNFTLLAK